MFIDMRNYTYTWEYPEVSNSKEWVELGLIYYLNKQRNKKKTNKVFREVTRQRERTLSF